MPFSNVLQLYVPSIFPLPAFEKFVSTVKAATLDESDARREFNGASNLIGWRFRACVEEKERYMASWRQYGADVSFDAIYQREKALFGVFVSGLSSLEAAVYSCYALASDPGVLGFPFDESIRRYKSGPKHLLEKLKATNASFALVAELEKLVSSDEWQLWTSFRNTMTHRSNLPLINFAVVGADPPPVNPLEFAATWSSKALSGDEAAFDALLSWLAHSLEGMLSGGTKLAKAASAL